MSQRRAKRSVICIDSSSEEDEDEEEEEEEDGSEEEDDSSKDVYDLNEDDDDGSEEVDDSEDGDDPDEGEENSDQSSSDHWSDEDEEGSDEQEDSGEEDEDEGGKAVDDESLSEMVVRLLREGNDLGTLSIQQCKAYLRKHRLRIAGTKAICIERIKEHRRIKDGNVEALYPRSSFSIDCTGDVGKGDIILFKQKVYKRFDKVQRRGHFLGRRTIAGRVVKDSYGAAKQQHTFTVEVLWSRGMKKLPPLFPLLVKGRNLYRLKTYRQHWKDEAERLGVLAEKHERGAAARLIKARNKLKRMQSESEYEGTKRRKRNSCAKPSRVRAGKETLKHANRQGKNAAFRYVNSTCARQMASSVAQARPKPNKEIHSLPLTTSQKHPKSLFPEHRGIPSSSHTYYPPRVYSHADFRHHMGAPQSLSGNKLGSRSATMKAPLFRPYAHLPVRHIPLYQGLPHGTFTGHVSPNHTYEPTVQRNFGHFPARMYVDRPRHPFYWDRDL